MTLETNLESRSCDLLRAHGADPVKRGQDGELDREVFWGRGLHFWVEFKKEETGRLRPSQRVWIKYKKPVGDLHYVVDTYAQMVEIVATWELIAGPATAIVPLGDR